MIRFLRFGIAWLVPALVGTSACATRAADATMRSGGPEAVVRAHLAAQNAHNIDRILATLADTVLFQVPTARGDSAFWADRRTQRAMYGRSIQAMPQSHFEIVTLLVSGPVVVTREEITGLGGGASDVGATAYWVANDRIVREQILNGSERSGSP